MKKGTFTLWKGPLIGKRFWLSEFVEIYPYLHYNNITIYYRIKYLCIFLFSIYFYSFFSSYQHFSHSTCRSLRDVAIPNRITMFIKEWCIKVDQCTRIVPPTGTALFCTSVIIVIICTELVSNYSMWSKCITYQKNVGSELTY